MKKNCGQLIICAGEAHIDRILGILALQAQYGWEEKAGESGLTVFSIYGENEEYLHKIANSCQQISPEITVFKNTIQIGDYLEEWKEFFTPVICGNKFVALPPWLKDRDFGERIKILIEPKSAFGTGHHATTALCLSALSYLLEKGFVKAGYTFLDLGCGSGILGLAATLANLSGLCVDNDPIAVDNANENKILNSCKNLPVKTGDLSLCKNQRFNLVMANILAQPLADMAPQIISILDSDYALILSGILQTQAEMIEQAYGKLGKPEKLFKDEWVALVWHS